MTGSEREEPLIEKNREILSMAESSEHLDAVSSALRNKAFSAASSALKIEYHKGQILGGIGPFR